MKEPRLPVQPFIKDERSRVAICVARLGGPDTVQPPDSSGRARNIIMTTLSVIIPAFNEESGITRIVERVLSIREPLQTAGRRSS